MALKKTSQSKKIYTVLIHVGFWTLVFLWPLVSLDNLPQTQYIVNRNWLATASLFVVFYINYFVLADRYFFNKKKVLFFTINLLLVIGIIFLVNYLLKLMIFNPTLDGVRLREVRSATVSYLQFVLPIILGIGMCIGLKTNERWSKNELLLQKARQSQLDAEIKYLRYQIQPHFLFNTLNNVYSLIGSSPDAAKNSVHSLSKMMRYLLHDSEKSKVPLTKEVDFLERYIELMQIRTSSNLTIEKSFPVINQPIFIAPLLLITFVENAFKHGVDSISPSHIKIELTLEESSLHFCVVNSLFRDRIKVTNSGVGMKNLRKRLELLYPEGFELSTSESDHTYTSSLTLKHTV